MVHGFKFLGDIIKMKKNKFVTFIVGLLFIISFLASMLLIFLLVKNNIFPNKYKVPFFVLVGIINIFVLIQIIREKFKSIIFILLFLAVIFIWGDYYIIKGVDALHKMRENSLKSKVQMSIVVLKESEIDTLNDLKNRMITAPLELDKDNINMYLNKTKGMNVNLKISNSSSYEKSAVELLDKNSDAMLLNQAYIENINQVVKGFSDKIKYINKIEVVTEEKAHESIDVDTSKESFHVYLSGIDTYGSIQSKARSDVNIIMTVNPITKNILLTSVPRDSYVKVADKGRNQYDKLTHAGVYGVTTSIHTLENLLDIKINYFSRINFSSFVKIVDTIGGIEVDNPRAFRTRKGGFFFKKGNIKLNGTSALAFARERYNLPGGDNDRGKNQERVVKAIINKVISPTILSNYGTILNDVSSSVQTNMSVDEIIELVNMQLSDNASWKISMQSLSGKGAKAKSYAAGGRILYVTRLSQKSIDESIEKINKVFNGESIE